MVRVQCARGCGLRWRGGSTRGSPVGNTSRAVGLAGGRECSLDLGRLPGPGARVHMLGRSAYGPRLCHCNAEKLPQPCRPLQPSPSGDTRGMTRRSPRWHASSSPCRTPRTARRHSTAWRGPHKRQRDSQRVSGPEDIKRHCRGTVRGPCQAGDDKQGDAWQAVWPRAQAAAHVLAVQVRSLQPCMRACGLLGSVLVVACTVICRMVASEPSLFCAVQGVSAPHHKRGGSGDYAGCQPSCTGHRTPRYCKICTPPSARAATCPSSW